MPRSAAKARDVALARMRRINGWLIAGAVVGTGLLTDVTAQAFPGRTITRRAASLSSTPSNAARTGAKQDRGVHHHAGLRPPAQAPRVHTPQVVEPVPGGTSAPVTPAPVTAVTSAPATPAPTAAPAPVAPAPVSPAPVVSGGS